MAYGKVASLQTKKKAFYSRRWVASHHLSTARTATTTNYFMSRTVAASDPTSRGSIDAFRRRGSLIPCAQMETDVRGPVSGLFPWRNISRPHPHAPCNWADCAASATRNNEKWKSFEGVERKRKKKKKIGRQKEMAEKIGGNISPVGLNRLIFWTFSWMIQAALPRARFTLIVQWTTPNGAARFARSILDVAAVLIKSSQLNATYIIRNDRRRPNSRIAWRLTRPRIYDPFRAGSFAAGYQWSGNDRNWSFRAC